MKKFRRRRSGFALILVLTLLTLLFVFLVAAQGSVMTGRLGIKRSAERVRQALAANPSVRGLAGAHIDMQQPSGLKEVIDVQGLARDMLDGAVVRQRLVHGQRRGGLSFAIHRCAPLASRNGSPVLVGADWLSRKNRCSRFCAANMRYSRLARQSVSGV